MIDFDKWQEIFHTLKSNKLRTFLTAMGIFWGIFMLVIMLGASTGLKNGVMQGFGDFATNSMFIWTEKTLKPYDGYPRGRTYYFTNDDAIALKQNIPEIDIVSPRVFGKGGLTYYNKNSGSFQVIGDIPEANLIDPVDIAKGRFINRIDILEKRKVAVIGERVKQDLFGNEESPLNKYIRIEGVYFKVVGVFKSRKQFGQGDHENQQIRLPFTTVQKIYNYKNDVAYFAVIAKKGTPVSEIEDKAVEILKKRHHIHPEDDLAVGHFNLEKEYKKMTGLFAGISGLSWIVGIGTLLSGIIGLSNIMLVAVKERTSEIGIKRAIGAKPILIIKQIISETLFLTSLTGYLGLVGGLMVVELVNKMISQAPGGGEAMFANPEVDIKVAVSALVILIIAGTLAGILPARRAVSIKPIDALRDE